ncbi:LOG family protein [Catellatospora bangladeshensis]|uniref:LOG family protein n=1 Tax=Catellatospora bangladeshensis TaxID=310355 RepID=UPI001944B257|nr:LOG family protein [Catellatospora bangladeshensis]
MSAATPLEIESVQELAERLAEKSLAGLTVQGLTIDQDLSRIKVKDAVFIGCSFPSLAAEAALVRRGAHVVPVADWVPYPTHPARLYTAADLTAGFAEGGFANMYDSRVYRHFVTEGGPNAGVREALAQRLHDHGIDNALHDAAADWAPARRIGIMGGHAELRGSGAYRLAAAIGHGLAGAGRLIVTGGGPGVMEAANLGSYLAAYPVEALDAAVGRLAEAPDFHDHDPYTQTALHVLAEYPAVDLWAGGLSVPTWLYGHEPANVFAGQIAKYFSNAIREDVILKLARGGIVFAPGRAGTVQEVFQAATKTYYATDGDSGPFVFLGRRFWTEELPVTELLRTLLGGAELASLVHVTDDVTEALAILC